MEVQRSVGGAGADGAGQDPGVHPGGSGRRGHGVPGRPGEVAAQGDGRGRAEGIPQRVREAAEADVGLGDRAGVPASGPRRGGTVREPGVAAVRAADEGGGRAGGAVIPARSGRGGLRVGPAWSAGRRSAAVEVHGAPSAGAVGRGARRVGAALARGPGVGLRLGGRDLCKGGSREGQGGAAGRDRSHGRRHQGSPCRGAGLPRVGRVVGCGAAEPQGPGRLATPSRTSTPTRTPRRSRSWPATGAE